MELEVRAIDESERLAFRNIIDVCFGQLPEPDALEHFQTRIPDLRYCISAFDNGNPISCVYALPFEMTLPGSMCVPVAWVAAVGTLPSHQGLGVATATIAKQLQALKQDGYAFAALGTEDKGLYRNVGYFPSASQFEVTLGRERALTGDTSRPENITFGTTIEVDELIAFHNAWRRRQVGEISRDLRAWQKVVKTHPMYVALRDEAGHLEAAACYAYTQPRAIRIHELFADTPELHRQLLIVICNIDNAETITFRALSSSDPLRMVLAKPGLAQWTRNENPWLRILDIERALSSRTYSSPGSLNIEVIDSTLPENAGVFNLIVDEKGVGQCTRNLSSNNADITIDIAYLAGAYFGEHTFTEFSNAEFAQERWDGALRLADEMFRTNQKPYCSVYEI